MATMAKGVRPFGNAEGPADEDFTGLIRGDAEPYGTEVEVDGFRAGCFQLLR